VQMVQSVVSVSYSFNHVSLSEIVNCENIWFSHWLLREGQWRWRQALHI
jgi:hypothetical protein